MSKYLENCQLIKENVYRIRESFTLTDKDYKKLPLTESTQMIESEGKKYKSVGAFEFRVWHLNQVNRNGRIYSDKLAEHVIKLNPVCVAYMDHPSDNSDGSVKDIYSVQRHPHIREGWLCCDVYLTGRHGRDILEILEAGGPVQISSSVCGSLDDYGVVQLNEDFMFERFGDAVTNCSNGYMNTLETSSISESTQQPSSKNLTILNNDAINDKILVDNILNEEKNMSNTSKKASYLEKNFIDYVNRKSKEIEVLGVEDKINQYTELLECFNDDEVKNFSVTTLKESVVKKLDEAKIEFKTLADKGKETDSLKETKKQLKEKLEKLEKDYQKLQANFTKVCSIAEESKVFYGKYKSLLEIEKATANGKVDAKDFLNVLAYSKELEEKVKEFNTNLKAIKEEKKLIEKKLNDKIKEDKIKSEKIKKIIADKKMKEAEVKKQAEIKKQKEAKEIEDLKKKLLAEKKANELNIRNNDEVNEYYLEMVRIYPFIKNYREKFLACKTLNEAYKVFLDVKDSEERSVSKKQFTEKVEQSEEEVNFVFTNMVDEVGKGFKY